MKVPKAGKRHSLLIYRRFMDRLAGWTLVLGILLLSLWGWTTYQPFPIITPTEDIWFLIGGIATLGFAIFAYLARFVAYIQPRRDHLRLVTPFLRLNIAYRRIRSVHPADFHKLFPPQDLSSADKRFLSHFYGHTAVVVELSAYPMSQAALRLFLPRTMFSRQTQAMIFLVPDWMAFSTEIDAFRGRWQQLQGRRNPAPGKWR